MYSGLSPSTEIISTGAAWADPIAVIKIKACRQNAESQRGPEHMEKCSSRVEWEQRSRPHSLFSSQASRRGQYTLCDMRHIAFPCIRTRHFWIEDSTARISKEKRLPF